MICDVLCLDVESWHVSPHRHSLPAPTTRGSPAPWLGRGQGGPGTLPWLAVPCALLSWLCPLPLAPSPISTPLEVAVSHLEPRCQLTSKRHVLLHEALSWNRHNGREGGESGVMFALCPWGMTKASAFQPAGLPP